VHNALRLRFSLLLAPANKFTGKPLAQPCFFWRNSKSNPSLFRAISPHLLKMLMSSEFFDKKVVQELSSLDGERRRELVKKIWPGSNARRDWFDEFSCKAVMEHIVRELDHVRHHRSLFVAQHFDATLTIIRTIQQDTSKRYEEVVRALLGQFPNANPDAVRRSIELTVRMWLTINTHSSDIFVGPMSAGDAPIDWEQDISLEQLLRSRFGRRIQLPRQRSIAMFDPAFTATYLVNTCGVRLQWTDDLFSHLNFDLKRLVLTVYRHKACLLSHIDCPQGSPIPQEVMEEVLDTMDLLFPPWDADTKRLLLKERQQSLFTLGCRKSGRTLDVAHYRYFGEALENLIDSFDKTPRTWRQLALDRRNKLEWSAFWVTVMVAVLTIVSIPCNLVQATYSVKAYRVALAQGNSTGTENL
jgi:hypothetical protein